MAKRQAATLYESLAGEFLLVVEGDIYVQVTQQYGLWMPYGRAKGAGDTHIADLNAVVQAAKNGMPGVWCTDAMIAIYYYNVRVGRVEDPSVQRARVHQMIARNHI